MFNLFSDIKTILLIVLALAIIGLVIYLLVKYPITKYIFVGIVCLLVIVSGVFCGYADIQYFTAKGGIYGTIDSLINKNEVVQQNYEFDFKNLSLTLTDNSTYSARITFTDENSLRLNCSDKALFVNQMPTNLVKKASNYIISQYGYTFYDEEIQELCSDFLTIKFSFEDKITTCIISTSGGSSSAKYWNNYLKKNNFKVTIEEENYNRDISVNIEKATQNILKYYVNDELYQTTTYTVGEEIELINFEIEEEYLFFGWFTEKPQGNLKELESITTITSNEAVEINLYAKYFHINDKVEGYNDCQLDIEFVYTDELVETDSYGVLILSYYDQEYDAIRKINIIIKSGLREIKGLKYAEYTMTFRTTYDAGDIEPYTFKAIGYNKIVIEISASGNTGVYDKTTV